MVPFNFLPSIYYTKTNFVNVGLSYLPISRKVPFLPAVHILCINQAFLLFANVRKEDLKIRILCAENSQL